MKTKKIAVEPTSETHDVVATLTIIDAAKMKKRTRTRLATWLSAQADRLEYQSGDYAKKYTARMWEPKPKVTK